MAMLLLEKDELRWIAEIRNCQMKMRAAFRLYGEKKINERQLILELKKTFRETDQLLMKLGKRGI